MLLPAAELGFDLPDALVKVFVGPLILPNAKVLLSNMSFISSRLLPLVSWKKRKTCTNAATQNVPKIM